jgi:GNAT superfamily N-acetyltransferase
LYRNADRGCGQQEAHDAVIAGARHEADVIVEDRRNDARGTIGRRRHDAAAGRVFLVHGQRIKIDPVHRGQWIAQSGLARAAQRPEQLRGAALDLHAARQDAFLMATALDTVLHDAPDIQQAVADCRLGAPRLFVFEH